MDGSQPLQRWDQSEGEGETETSSHSGYHGVQMNKYTHAQTHKRSELSKESLFHLDLLSLSNVWYAGIQALLNDLICMGLPRHQLVCTCVCV